MKRVQRVIVALFAIAVLAVPAAAFADFINVLPADFSGSRTSNGGGVNGVIGSDNTEWETDFKISWEITALGGGQYKYEYNLTNIDGSTLAKAVSHLILGVSPSFTSANVLAGSRADGEIKTYSPSDPGNSNPGLPGDLYGIKWNTSPGDETTFVLYTDRAPVWGSFYAKDGKDDADGKKGDPSNNVYAYNTGFAGGNPYPVDDASFNKINWIATPDTTTVVPVPPALVMLGTGLLPALGYIGLIRRRKPASV